jgi:hypothetical protein
MEKQIFRKVSLERLSSPEQLDQLMHVTSPRGWIALVGLSIVLLIALLWGFFGSIATTVEGQGILIRPEGVNAVISSQSGIVTSVLVRVGDVIYKDREVVRLTQTNSDGPPAEPFITAKTGGRVLEILVKEGNPVEKGTVVVILEPLDDVLQALIYVPIAKGLRVQDGMKVEVSPSAVKASEFGYMVGQVTSASKFPSSRQGMMRNLENEELVRSLLGAGPCVQVTAELFPDADSPSGYKWSSSRGPAVSLAAGTSCRVLITVREQRPISLVIPSMRDLLGL